MQLLQLRIKDNVDHAGLFPPLEDSKVSASLLMELSKASQNNNWLIAQEENMEIKHAMEDLWTTLSSSLKTTELSMKINIPTKLLSKPAQKLEDHSKFQDSLILKIATL